MKIALAQLPAKKGDVEHNVAEHVKMIRAAAAYEVEIIIFPELSLSGYEPTLAGALALSPDDPRLKVFQDLSDLQGITIAIGAPLRVNAGTAIGLIIFQPKRPLSFYFKKFLHADEEAFFVSESNQTLLLGGHDDVALSICYEISVPEHAKQAAAEGAGCYIASVAKFTNGIDKALERLSEIAGQFQMTVLMANAVGPADGALCAGKSSVWNKKGILIGQLSETRTGLLMYDTEKLEISRADFP